MHHVQRYECQKDGEEKPSRTADEKRADKKAKKTEHNIFGH
ncbi:Hypothetical protein Pchl3084_4463 [Pseudomonas chlororaphis subsp. aureofaciens 30-84]|nr:hypothetical protein C4K18_4537 [Pseudomonas chlororaphis subsp. aurantiaca]EJL00286.1 Hypothetical protein Pchl3084_4463 [Pseudomonas chlororaphis subsp. aureofaciens 30-84]